MTFNHKKNEGHQFLHDHSSLGQSTMKFYPYISTYKLVKAYLVLVYGHYIFIIIKGSIHMAITPWLYNLGVKYYIVTYLWDLKFKN